MGDSRKFACVNFGKRVGRDRRKHFVDMNGKAREDLSCLMNSDFTVMPPIKQSNLSLLEHKFYDLIVP